MHHAFLDCSQHSPWRWITVVCSVWPRPNRVVLTKTNALTVVDTAALRQLKMTGHFHCFVELTRISAANCLRLIEQGKRSRTVLCSKAHYIWTRNVIMQPGTSDFLRHAIVCENSVTLSSLFAHLNCSGILFFQHYLPSKFSLICKDLVTMETV